jgi:hypothetical protein
VTNQAASSTNGSHVGGSGLWEAQAVLLLWLSILILSPFDLVILDSSVTDSSGGAAAAQAGYPPLAAKVMVLCQDFLSQPGARGTPNSCTALYCTVQSCTRPAASAVAQRVSKSFADLLQLLFACCAAADNMQVPCVRWQRCCWRGC